MRIISSFKDYYDCGMAYGFDPNIVYARETSQKKFKAKDLASRYEDWIVFYIGFAGKIYQAYQKDKIQFTKPTLKQKKWHRSWEELELNRNKPEQLNIFFEDAPVFLATKGYYYEMDYRGWMLTLNPRLNTVDFQQILPPVEAYQQLSMWYGNRCFNENSIPEVSDKDLAEAKGFNKYSFRKEREA